MGFNAQDKFRKSVKVWLALNEMSVKQLALRIGRRRDTVSTAINRNRFPIVRAEIRAVISK